MVFEIGFSFGAGIEKPLLNCVVFTVMEELKQEGMVNGFKHCLMTNKFSQFSVDHTSFFSMSQSTMIYFF